MMLNLQSSIEAGNIKLLVFLQVFTGKISMAARTTASPTNY